MDIVVEIIVNIAAVLVYGTEKRPRHPIWRYLARAIAFGGLIVAGASILGLVGPFPTAIIVLWLFFMLIVIVGEYEFGDPYLFFAAITVSVVLVAGAIYTSL